MPIPNWCILQYYALDRTYILLVSVGRQFMASIEFNDIDKLHRWCLTIDLLVSPRYIHKIMLIFIIMFW